MIIEGRLMGRKAWKLKEADVVFIRANYPKFSGNQLARLFGVSQGMIYDIVKGNRRGKTPKPDEQSEHGREQ